MSEHDFPQQCSTFGLDLCLVKIQNIRSQSANEDPRLGLAEQSIQAALHWLSQPPKKDISNV